MKKKATTKKISEKSNRKEIEKKIRTALRSPEKITRKKKEVKKVKAKAKVEKKPGKVKIKEKQKKVAKKVSTKVKKKFEKIEKKIVEKIKRKFPPKAAEKEKIKKITEKPAEKIKVKAKVKVEVKEKPKRAVKELKEVKKGYPAIEAKYSPTPWEALPTEYGENGITLMTVDPYKLFTFWEVREDTLKIFKGDLSIRVYDVTGIDFDRMDANSYFDIPVSERIGKLYIDVSPAKEFIVDIGIMYEGIFITIARSNKISTPYAEISEEGLLPQKLYETGLRVGY